MATILRLILNLHLEFLLDVLDLVLVRLGLISQLLRMTQLHLL